MARPASRMLATRSSSMASDLAQVKTRSSTTCHCWTMANRPKSADIRQAQSLPPMPMKVAKRFLKARGSGPPGPPPFFSWMLLAMVSMPMSWLGPAKRSWKARKKPGRPFSKMGMTKTTPSES